MKSDLRTALEEYLATRRALGFDLRKAGHALHHFVSFLEQEGAAFITRDLALRWAKQPAKADPGWWWERLGFVRRFAQCQSATDSRTEIPPPGLLPRRYRRKPPYVYSDDEIAQILLAARSLRSPRGLRAHTYSTLFGLMAATGMRTSEAAALRRDDVDWAERLLVVRKTKFQKSRLAPLHPSSCERTLQYARRRDRCHPEPKTDRFFVSDDGRRLGTKTVQRTFRRITRKIGLSAPAGGREPRLHDLRHRFAVKTLAHWYRSGMDVELHIRDLATYLGHTHVADTYWYLADNPELLSLAAMLLDRPAGGASS